jgi:hypothetical protein
MEEMPKSVHPDTINYSYPPVGFYGQYEAAISEDDRVNQQMAQLFVKSELRPSPDAQSSTFRIDLSKDTKQLQQQGSLSEHQGWEQWQEPGWREVQRRAVEEKERRDKAKRNPSEVSKKGEQEMHEETMQRGTEMALKHIKAESDNEGEANKIDKPLPIESGSKDHRKSKLQPYVEHCAESDTEDGCEQIDPDQERKNLQKKEASADELAVMPAGEPANKKKRGTPTRAMAQQRAQEAAARGEVYPPPRRGRVSDTASQKPAGLGSEKTEAVLEVTESLDRSSSHRTGPSRFGEAYQYLQEQDSFQPYPVVQHSTQHEKTPTNSWTSHVGNSQTLTALGPLPTTLCRPQTAPSQMLRNEAGVTSVQTVEGESFKVEMMDETVWNFYDRTTTAEPQASPHAVPSVDQNGFSTPEGTLTDEGMLI